MANIPTAGQEPTQPTGHGEAAHQGQRILATVRCRTASAGEPREFGTGADFLAFMEEPQGHDMVVEVVSGPVQVLDIDVHDWSVKPTEAHLCAIASSLAPQPAAWFRSHGGGVKAIYFGSDAALRATVAGLGVPVAMQVEVLGHLRHPRSASPAHGGVEAGALHRNPGESAAPIDLQRLGQPSADQVQDFLDEAGMVLGDYYGHDKCPIAGDEPSDAGSCVYTTEEGVYCHRCAGKGFSYPGGTTPGFTPYTALLGGVEMPRVVGMARSLVHWCHARIVMDHIHSNLGPRLREVAYRAILAQVHGADDPRINAVFNPQLMVIYTTGGWRDAATGAETELDNDLVDAMPCVQRLEVIPVPPPRPIPVEPGQPPVPTPPPPPPLLIAKIDRPRRSTVKARTPPGYLPITLYRGLWLGPADAIPFHVPPLARHPVRLLPHPLPEEACWAAIERAFPGISRTYLKACLAADICAAKGAGMPPMIACTGPSGSGKTETVAIAVSFLGDYLPRMQMLTDSEAFFRQIGTAITAGHHLLLFDEFGRAKGLGQQLPQLLQLNHHVTYRPLYDRERTVANTAAVVFAVIRLPDWLTSSPEFVRRTRGLRLPRRVGHWIATSGGDGAAWRDRSAVNAEVANSLVTHVHLLCDACGYQFTGTEGCVADRLGLGSIADGVEGLDTAVFCRLYQYARGEQGVPVPLQNSTFVRGWLDLAAPQIHELVAAFCDAEQTDLPAARRAVQINLEAAAWNDILGIADPPIRCQVKIHGKSWGFRFQSDAGHARGTEPVNAQLPPMPGTATSPPAPEPAVPVTLVVDAAEVALLEAGFPVGSAS